MTAASHVAPNAHLTDLAELRRQIAGVESMIAELTIAMSGCTDGNPLHQSLHTKRQILIEVRETLIKLGNATNAVQVLLKAL